MTNEPEWIAISRETQLAASLVARGITLLGKANHAQSGVYAQALFALSIGFERAGKLVYVADHAITHGGAFPSNEQLRDLGHDLLALMPVCEAISARVAPGRRWAQRPNDPIHKAMIRVISEFGKRSRYYNLNYLSGKAQAQVDPIADWWRSVAEPLLARHYKGSRREADAAGAALMGALVGDDVHVVHTSETGQEIESLEQLSLRAAETRVVQKYGMLYALQIARWFASLIYEISNLGAYTHRVEALLGLQDCFTPFYNEDDYLKSRKSWTIYPGTPGV